MSRRPRPGPRAARSRGRCPPPVRDRPAAAGRLRARLGGLPELLEERLDLSVEMLDAHTTVRAPRKVRAAGDVPSPGRSGGPLRGSDPMSRARPRSRPPEEGRPRQGPPQPGLPGVNLLSPAAFDLLTVRGLRCASPPAARAGPAGRRPVDRPAPADHRDPQARRRRAGRDRPPQLRDPGAAAGQDVRRRRGRRSSVTVQTTMAREIYFSQRAGRHPPGDPRRRHARQPRGRPSRRPTRPPRPGPAPAAAPTVSPCPGPDPFNTKPVIGCITLSGTAMTRAQVGELVIALARTRPVRGAVHLHHLGRGQRTVTFSGSVGLSQTVVQQAIREAGGPPVNLRTPVATKIVGASSSSSSPRSAGSRRRARDRRPRRGALRQIQSTRDQNQVLATQLHALEAQRGELGPTRTGRGQAGREVPAHRGPAGAVRGGHRGRRRRRHRPGRCDHARASPPQVGGADAATGAVGAVAGDRWQPGQPRP